MKTALVLGGARCLDADLDATEAFFAPVLGEPPIIIATNHAGRDYPGPLPHWVSFHAELFPRWAAERAAAGRPDAGQIWTEKTRARANNLPNFRHAANWGGSSGLMAVTVALEELGLDRIILCGVPLDPAEAHYDDDERWKDAGNYRRAWVTRRAQMGDKVRSMSGWTRDLLGAPSARWLRGEG